METNKNKLCERTKQNTKVLRFWTAMWTLSMFAATFGPKYVWDHNNIFSILTIIINLGLGIKMILANIRFIKGLDELQQKIQLEAMGITLGIAVIVGLSYSLLERTGVIHFHAGISQLVMLMGLTYLAGIYIGRMRYK